MDQAPVPASPEGTVSAPMYWLYIVRSPSGLRKIGYTKNIDCRLNMIIHLGYHCLGHEVGSFTPEDTFLVPAADAKAAEGHAHAIVWDARVLGEWFSISREQATDAILEGARAAAAGAAQQRPGGLGGPGDAFGKRKNLAIRRQLAGARTIVGMSDADICEDAGVSRDALRKLRRGYYDDPAEAMAIVSALRRRGVRLRKFPELA